VEFNSLSGKAADLLKQFYAKEEELQRKDVLDDRAKAVGLAREEVAVLTQCVAAVGEAALRAERLSKMSLGGSYPAYFSAVARMERKRVEMLEAMRERAEMLLSDEPTDAVTLKRNTAVEKIERLRKEADDLEQQAESMRGDKRP
jgi:ABC-type branched-subunit amino acid transport system ATPase component